MRQLYSNKLKVVVLSTIAILASITKVAAQDTMEDVIYLKNGSTIRGQIVEQKIGEYLRIKSAEQMVWVFETSIIERITKEDPIVEVKKISYKKSGYYNITDVGLLAGWTELENRQSLSILVANGYKFENSISIGVVTGVEMMDLPMVPVMLELRYDFVDNKSSPFVSARAGSSFLLENDVNEQGESVYQGGYSVGSVVGIRNYFTNTTALVFSVGFRRTQLISERVIRCATGVSPEDLIQVDICNRLDIRLGFMFN